MNQRSPDGRMRVNVNNAPYFIPVWDVPKESREILELEKFKGNRN